MSHPLDQLICPLDQTPLSHQGNGLCCAGGHRFDCAKSGYVNLLPVQGKRSRDPGDSKAMVAARRAFLDAGHYQPLASALIERADALPQPPTALLDAGCGEGYYLDQLYRHLAKQDSPPAAQGLDISKWAVAAASKRNPAIGWLVASNAAIPAPAARYDLLLCLFGFPVFAEFARVLRPGGVLLLADSGPEHLIELRRILYPQLRPHRARYPDGVGGFELLSERRLRFDFSLKTPAAIEQLLAMTPHLHKAPHAGREAALALTELALSADIELRCYRVGGAD